MRTKLMIAVILAVLLAPWMGHAGEESFLIAEVIKGIRNVEAIADFTTFEGDEKLLFESCVFFTSMKGAQVYDRKYTFMEATELIAMQDKTIRSYLCLEGKTVEQVVKDWKDLKTFLQDK
jgi:hypothetical protein